MIINERQYAVSKARAERFREAVARLDHEIAGRKDITSRLIQAEREGYAAQLSTLDNELHAYERRKAAGQETVPTVPLSKLLAELAEKHQMSRRAVGSLFGDFVGLTVKNLKRGNKVRITGLGVMQVRNRPARLGRNPATGEPIRIKASKKIAFRVAQDLKEAI